MKPWSRLPGLGTGHYEERWLQGGNRGPDKRHPWSHFYNGHGLWHGWGTTVRLPEPGAVECDGSCVAGPCNVDTAEAARQSAIAAARSSR